MLLLATGVMMTARALIASEHRSALLMNSVGAGAEAKYEHRSFAERPPELNRELGRMKRISNSARRSLGSRANPRCTRLLQSPAKGPQKGLGSVFHGAACGLRMVDLGALPRLERPPSESVARVTLRGL